MHLPRNAAVALGGTTLAMVGLLEPLVGRGKHLALYHWQGSPTNLYGPAVLGFALVFACLLILLSCGMRPGRWRVAVWGGLLLLLPAFVANGARVLLHLPAVVPAVLFWAGVVALAGLVVFWRDRYSTGFERTVFLGSRGLQVAAFTGAFCLLQILWFWWSARGLNAARPLHAAAGQARANPAHPRVIWIVFDELSFQQGFAERYPGLQLPAFDALAAQSATFTQVRPAEAKADIVLPALIAGKAVKAIRASARGDLWLQTGTGRDWNQLAPSDTIFQDALDAGYRTGVAGWFNPYCRILPSVLDRCSWQYHTSMDNGLGSDETFAGNLAARWQRWWGARTVGAGWPCLRAPAHRTRAWATSRITRCLGTRLRPCCARAAWILSFCTSLCRTRPASTTGGHSVLSPSTRRIWTTSRSRMHASGRCGVCWKAWASGTPRPWW